MIGHLPPPRKVGPKGEARSPATEGSRGGASPDFIRGGSRMNDLDDGADAAGAVASLLDRSRVVVVVWSRVRSPARELRKARSL